MTNRIEGLEKTLKALESFDIDKDAIKKALRDEGENLVQVIRNLIPDRTGRMVSAYKMFDSDRFKTSVMLGYDYTPDGRGMLTKPALASIIEYGRAEGYPKKKEYLRFRNAQGEWVTTKSVAAITGKAPVRRGFDMNKKTVEKNMEAVVDMLLKKEAKKKNLKTK